MNLRPFACVTLFLTLCVGGTGFAQRSGQEFQLGPVINDLYLPVDPVGSVNYQPGIGCLASLSFGGFFGFDSTVSITPTAPSTATSFAGGRLTQFSLGVRGGLSRGRFSFYGKARPGLASFGKAIVQVGPQPDMKFQFGRLTEPSIDLGGIVQAVISKRLSLRYEAGDTVIYYRGRNVFADRAPMSGRAVHSFQFAIAFLYSFKR